MSPLIPEMHLVTEIDNCRTCGQSIGLQPMTHTWIHLDHHLPEHVVEVPVGPDAVEPPPFADASLCCVWHYAEGKTRILLDEGGIPLPGQALAVQHDKPEGTERCRWCDGFVIRASDVIKNRVTDSVKNADPDLQWLGDNPPAFLIDPSAPFWIHLDSVSGVPTAVCWSVNAVRPISTHKYLGEFPC
jgi:hypothetical protein